eukprot:GILI01040404.1.p1 GENE.GILI01040404.1~~GILI01040404.1.p1  ORF type:complete len:182 (-),score=21.88 GILI01040404.1:279-752(-)
MTVFLQQDLPESWRARVSDPNRAPPLTLVADNGWIITTRALFSQGPTPRAAHGYDPVLVAPVNSTSTGFTSPSSRSPRASQDMQTVLLGSGPSIVPGSTVQWASVTEIYALIAQLLSLDLSKLPPQALGLVPGKSHGVFDYVDRWVRVLKNPPDSHA